jgi:hypothetical protein
VHHQQHRRQRHSRLQGGDQDQRGRRRVPRHEAQVTIGMNLILGVVGQGCQMVYFHTRNPNLGKFWIVLQ